MIRNSLFFLALLIFVYLVNAQAGETRHFYSSDTANTLVELYTSEGCNSCPPAEEYLNNLTSHPGLWQTVFPVAFHVDYWNHLGWRDPYSKAQFSARQRDYARKLDKLFVYTPQLLVNSKPWRPGIFKHALPLTDHKSGKLNIKLQGDQFDARYESADSEATKYELTVAILGMGLHTSIKAGENAGREARHEFVVLALKQYHNNEKNNGTATWQDSLPVVNDDYNAKSRALVGWVSRKAAYKPLQAVGGLID